MRGLRTWRVGLLLASAFLAAGPTAAVTVTIDFDDHPDPAQRLGYWSPFFNSGTPAANQAKATLIAAAAYYSDKLTDTLDPVIAPTYSNPNLNPAVNISWHWDATFGNPNGAGNVTQRNLVIPSDVVRIFVGAQPLPDETLARSGPGGYSGWGHSGVPNNATGADHVNVANLNNTFLSALETRGETNGFATWGGSISFDSDRAWHSTSAAPAAGTTDLYTVALHEIGHVLGFGGAPQFDLLTKPDGFDGAAAKAVYGGPRVPLTADGGHWADGVSGKIYGTGAPQTPLMAASVPPAMRRLLTTLDAAALSDIGWSVAPPPTPAGDYDRNGRVDLADYVLWRNTRGLSIAAGTGADGSGNGSIGDEDYTFWRARFGNTNGSAGGAAFDGSGITAPEPSSALLAVLACTVALCSRWMWRR